jgi:hypothetical protein
MTNKTPSFVYSVKDAAQTINHPLTNTQPKMFNFLRRYGILDDMMPKPELIVQGYFTMEFRLVKNGSFMKTVPLVRISQKGITFIQRLIKLIYG